MSRKIIFSGFLLLCMCSCQQKSSDVKTIIKMDTVFVEKIVYRDKEENQEEDDGYKKFNCYDGSQAEMNQCSRDEYLYYDSIMKVEYNKLLADFSEPDQKTIKESIINSQKEWEKSRGANAQYIFNLYEGGSIRPLAVNTAKISDTKARIRFLLEGGGF